MANMKHATMAIVLGAAAIATGRPTLASTTPLAPASNLFTLYATDESPKEQQQAGPISIGVDLSPSIGPRGTPPTTLDLTDPTHPIFTNPWAGGPFTLIFNIQGAGAGGTIPLPIAPDANGLMMFDDTINGMTLHIVAAFAPSNVDPASWASFNPQPDPPGDVLGIAFGYPTTLDPDVTISATFNDTPLSFSTPEPATWGTLLLGLGGLAAAASRRSAKRARTR